MTAPDVSIVVPCYNADPWLAAALESAVGQRGLRVEVIVVDDGSTDNSAGIAAGFADRGVRLLRQARRGGAAARNAGWRAATGAFLQFLDADDWLAPDKVCEQVTALQPAPPGRVAIGGVAFFQDGEDPAAARPYLGWPAVSTDDPAAWLLDLYGLHGHGGMVQPGQWLVPRLVAERAGPWNEALTVDDDGEFFCRVVLASTGLVKTPSAIAGYRQFRRGKRNLSARKSRDGLVSEWAALRGKQASLAPRSTAARFARTFAWNCFHFAVKAYPLDRRLSLEALAVSAALGGCDDEPILGGPALQWVVRRFGWKIACRLSACCQRLRSSLARSAAPTHA